MKRIVLASCIGAIALLTFGRMPEAHASWVSDNCKYSTLNVAPLKRSEARAYGMNADKEGYEWGGGCWNNNDRDDTPSSPDSNGEGPDCSGLTFKTWHLENGLHVNGWQKFGFLTNIHGPYSSYAFHDPVPEDPFRRLGSKDRSTTLFMDAFAKQGHIGVLQTSANPSSNTDYILEAYGDDAGTGVFVRSYRFDSAYKAIKREGWEAESCDLYCAPQGRVVPVP